MALGTRIVRITQELSKLYPGVLQIAEAAERFGTWEGGGLRLSKSTRQVSIFGATFFRSSYILYPEQFLDRRFPKILRLLFEGHTNRSDHFSSFFKDKSSFPKPSKKVSKMFELSIVQHLKLVSRKDVIGFFAIVLSERNPFNLRSFGIKFLMTVQTILLHGASWVALLSSESIKCRLCSRQCQR